MSPMDFASNGNWPQESDWDRYFNDYDVQYLNHSGDFIAYEDKGDEIFVRDFISDNPENSLHLWSELNKLAQGKKLKGMIHTANYKLLNTALKSGFEIKAFNGIQYLVERG
jgi:hypothetical protein